MSDWQPIETLREEEGPPVLLARFVNGQVHWVILAEWGVAMPGYVHCASYSGWFPRFPVVSNPGRHRRDYEPGDGGEIMSLEYPPTHWQPLHDLLPAQNPHMGQRTETENADESTA